MDGGLNKFATAIIAVFVLTFLLLVAQILYFLSRRRDQRGGEPNEKCFYIFCWPRNQSRIEPKEVVSISKMNGDCEGAVVVVEMAAVDNELEKWQELCGPSRTLFTIKEEEEEREGIIECFGYDPIPKLKMDEDTTPFHTPCASPPYFTPSSSPTRDSHDFPADRGCSEDNSTTPFSTIQITTTH
ncbi:uncharacterized protein LOC120091450 [Benincasa hispida]|uniref:uncharacterized protein LOC120091450 n=1 Tax=Benincasa hispida TaxID=102211 RepID=UPI001901421D|nr:uncharacterized protein LOC120091450 [Benincasa hispida]